MQLVRANRPQREPVQKGLPHFLTGSFQASKVIPACFGALTSNVRGMQHPAALADCLEAIWSLNAGVAVDMSVSFEPEHKARRLDWQRNNFFPAAPV